MSTVGSALMAVMLTAALVSSWNWAEGPRLFVQLGAGPALVLTLLDVWLRRRLAARRRASSAADTVAAAAAADRTAAMQAAARQRLFVFWTLGCFVAVWLFGLVFAAIGVVFLYLWLVARERWSSILITTFCTFLFMWVVLDYVFHFSMPLGVLTRLLF